MNKKLILALSLTFALPAVAQNPMTFGRYEEHVVGPDSQMFRTYLIRVRRHDDRVQFAAAALSGLLSTRSMNQEDAMARALEIGKEMQQMNEQREGLAGI